MIDTGEEMCMQFRQKMGYMALGGLLVLGGHVLPGLTVPKATAQGGLESADFDAVTVRSLSVLDDTGQVRAVMDVDPDGGMIVLYGNDGEARATMDVNPEGGTVHVFASNGPAGAQMTAREHGGEVFVFGSDEKAWATCLWLREASRR